MIKKLFNTHQETANNFFWRSLQIFSKQGVTFLIFFLAAKFLTPVEFGLLNYLMAVLALLMIFCDFGISTATSKYVAEYAAKKSRHLNKILFSVSAIIIGSAAVISLFIIFAGENIFQENYLYLLFFLPYLFLVPLTSVADGVYRGLKEFKKLAIISFFVGIISLVASYFLLKNYLFVGAILAQNFLYLLLTLALFCSIKDIKFKIDKPVLKKIIKYSLLIGLANIAFFMYSKVDILILKQFGYIVEIGYYEIINKIFNILLMPAVILGQVIAPNITRYVAHHNYDIVKNKLKKYLLLFFSFSIPLSIILYFVLPAILKIILPKYYTANFLLIMILLLILFPFKLWGVFCANGFITPGGFVKILTLTTLIGGVLNIILDYVFISIMGFIGVYWVTLTIHAMNILIATSYFYIKIKNEKFIP